MISTTNQLYAKWLQDESKRLHLAAILKDPTVVEALAIIRENYKPTTTTSTSKDPVVASAMYHTMGGAHGALDDLIQLSTEPNTAAANPLPPAWSHASNKQ